MPFQKSVNARHPRCLHPALLPLRAVFDFCLCDGLPLKVGNGIRPASAQRNDVVLDPPWACTRFPSRRWAGMRPLERCGTQRDLCSVEPADPARRHRATARAMLRCVIPRAPRVCRLQAVMAVPPRAIASAPLPGAASALQSARSRRPQRSRASGPRAAFPMQREFLPSSPVFRTPQIS
jgi:hypothetical protein